MANSFTYGVAPGYPVPADFPQLTKQFGFHAVYRRPAFGSTGKRLTDDKGKPAWDTLTTTTRDHFRSAEQGFELAALSGDAPAEVRAAFAAAATEAEPSTSKRGQRGSPKAA